MVILGPAVCTKNESSSMDPYKDRQFSSRHWLPLLGRWDDDVEVKTINIRIGQVRLW